MSDSSLTVALKITGDAKSATAALEAVRQSQLKAFAAGKEAADKAATAWKAAEGEVKRLSSAAKAAGGDQAGLSAAMTGAASAAGKAKAAWIEETAALQKRRQALQENKQALAEAAQASAAAASAAAVAAAAAAKAAPVSNARDMLGLVPHEQIRQQILAVQKAYLDLKTSGTLTGAELAQAADRTRTRIVALAEGMNGARTSGERMAAGMALAQRAFVAFQAIAVGSTVLKTADAMALLQARLALVEGSTQGAGTALAGIARIAEASAMPLRDAGTAYTKFAQSIYSLGGDQGDALKFTESIALALRISGASATESSAAMLQLGQAMQKGSLNGDEFSSVAENGGNLARALKVSRGELRQMSTEGKLSADKLLKINDVLALIKKDAEGLPQTVGGAVANLGSKWDLWIAKSATVRAASDAVVAGLKFLGNNLEAITWTGATAGAILLVSQLGRLQTALTVAMIALRAASFTPLGLALSAVALGVAWLTGKWVAAGEATDEAGSKMSVNAKRAEDAATALGTGVKAATETIKTAFETAAKASETLASKIGEHGRAASDNLKSAYDGRLRHIESHYTQAGLLLDNSLLSEKTKIQQGALLVAAAERDKLEATKEWATKAESISVTTHDKIVKLAQAAGKDVALAERASIGERIGIYTQLETAYRATVDKLIAEEQRLLGEAKRCAEELRLLKMSTEDRIRTLKQKAMGELEAYNDRERQVAEKTAAAQLALSKGNFTEAKRLAEEAMSLAERNASAVSRTVEVNGKKVTQEVISQGKASATAIDNLSKASKIAEAAVEGMGGAFGKAAKAVGTGAKEAQGGLDGVTTKLDELRTAMAQNLKLALSVDDEEIKKALVNLQTLADAKALLIRLKADTDSLTDSLADMKNIPERSREFALKASLSLDAINDDIIKLQAIAKEQKLDLPAQLNTDAAYKSIGTLREFIGKPTSADHTPVPDLAQYRAAVTQLERPTSSQHTVYVRTVEQHSVGGIVGASLGAGVKRFAVGGHLPGYGGGDRISALLEAGEFVMRKEAVRRYGIDAMMAINSMRTPLPAFAVGGIVGMPGVSAANQSGGREVIDINLRLPGTADPVRLQAPRGEAERLVQALNQLARVA